jgi:diguanylate cyclase (GGDEF)-like protein
MSGNVSENSLPRLWKVVVVGLLVGAFTFFGIELLKYTGREPVIWPANGFLFAVLLKTRPRSWPAYLLLSLATSIIAAILAGLPIDYQLIFPFINILEVALSLTLMHRYFDFSNDLSEPRILWPFTLIAVVLSPLFSVLLSAILFAFISTNQTNEAVFAAVFFAHALGIIIVAPVVLSFQRHELFKLFVYHKTAVFVVAFSFLTFVTVIVFIQKSDHLLFLLYPPLLLIVFLYRLPGGAFGIFLMTSIIFMLRGYGSLTLDAHVTRLENVIILQLFIVVAAILVLILSASLAERERVKEQLETAQKELMELASTDYLTGLANRRRLDEVFNMEYRRARRGKMSLAMLLLDIDCFKAFNDQYGHQAGDECLRKISSVVATFGGRPGDLAARYGGEELVVLLSPTNASFAEQTAEAMRTAIQELALPHAGNEAHGGVVTASIGVATYDADMLSDEPNALIKKADEMLYEAKRMGRNRVVSWENGLATVLSQIF